MKPPLHYGNVFSGQCAEHQLALVAGSGGNGKTGNFTVRNDNGMLCQIGHVAQTGAKDHGDLRLEAAQLLLYGIGGLLVVRKGITHSISSFLMMGIYGGNR